MCKQWVLNPSPHFPHHSYEPELIKCYYKSAKEEVDEIAAFHWLQYLPLLLLGHTIALTQPTQISRIPHC